MEQIPGGIENDPFMEAASSYEACKDAEKIAGEEFDKALKTVGGDYSKIPDEVEKFKRAREASDVALAKLEELGNALTASNHG